MVIFKGKTKRSIKGLYGKGGAVIVHQKKAWMDEVIMKQWIKDIWQVYTKKKPSLLFLDTFTAHLTSEVQDLFKKSNTTVIIIPGGCTSVLQPLDVSINKPFKDYLRRSWMEYMVDETERTKEVKPPTKQHIINWVISCWTQTLQL